MQQEEREAKEQQQFYIRVFFLKSTLAMQNR
jgi:hypothetical protein